MSEISIKGKHLIFLLTHHSRLLIFPDSFLEKVSFTLKRNVIHEIKRVRDIVHLQKQYIVMAISGVVISTDLGLV